MLPCYSSWGSSRVSRLTSRKPSLGTSARSVSATRGKRNNGVAKVGLFRYTRGPRTSANSVAGRQGRSVLRLWGCWDLSGGDLSKELHLPVVQRGLGVAGVSSPTFLDVVHLLQTVVLCHFSCGTQ